jgi:hypothetical protein
MQRRLQSNTGDLPALHPVNEPLQSEGSDPTAVARETIVEVLRECRGNETAAGRRFGLSRTQLYVRMRKCGLAGRSVVMWRSSRAVSHAIRDARRTPWSMRTSERSVYSHTSPAL